MNAFQFHFLSLQYDRNITTEIITMLKEVSRTVHLILTSDGSNIDYHYLQIDSVAEYLNLIIANEKTMNCNPIQIFMH